MGVEGDFSVKLRSKPLVQALDLDLNQAEQFYDCGVLAKTMTYGIWFSGFIGVVGLHIFIVDENCLLFLPSSVQALIMQAYRSVAKLNWLLG